MRGERHGLKEEGKVWNERAGDEVMRALEGEGLRPKSRMLEFEFHRAGLADDYDPDMEHVSKNHWNGGSQRTGEPGVEQIAHRELKVT